jgi:lipoprotein-anchoring transpeptidase ErfK/SrfK
MCGLFAAMINRRQILIGLPILLTSPSMAAEEEPFPVFRSDIERVEYRFRKREVSFAAEYPAGTIVVHTRKKYLYFVLGNGRAIRYGVGIGRQGSGWTGTATVKRKAKWPAWHPTPETLAQSKIVAEKYKNGFPGGPGNPLGARAMYLYQGNVDTLFRIHGTDTPTAIGKATTRGCLRMVNIDVIDLYDRVKIGTQVVVMKEGPV